ncbi:MAG: hypothetical protein M1831_005564 [Alyxoria varia]|nr:MAG: hypothetical protein M1831_005564 [Alyxoria varia]
MGACNFQIFPEDCTYETCCVEYQGSVSYIPTYAGNLIYLIIFGILAASQLGLGIWKRTWGFMIGMVLGCAVELAGYVGRLMMNDNVFQENPFLIYIVTLTIAPAFVTGAIYLCLGRIVCVHGPQYSRFKPGTYTAVFITCDIIALVLQALGGAITSTSDPGSSEQDTGVNIMIAGLAWQVVALGIFMILSIDFGVSVFRARRSATQPTDSKFDILRRSKMFKAFEVALAVATVLIFIRCCYRVAELREGFDGGLANNEPVFMVLEGPMIFISVGVLTVLHPGLAFKDMWGQANWSFRKGAKNVDAATVPGHAKLQGESDVELTGHSRRAT